MSETFTETSNRTPEDSFLGREIEDYNSPFYDKFLTSIFNFGTIPDETFELFEGFKVTLRLLTPAENIEVAKALDSNSNIVVNDAVLKIETLARAIVKINGNCLRFSDTNLEEYRAFRGISDDAYKPSEIEQQKHMLKYNFPPTLINIIYDKYTGLVKKQEDKFIELKKK